MQDQCNSGNPISWRNNPSSLPDNIKISYMGLFAREKNVSMVFW